MKRTKQLLVTALISGGIFGASSAQALTLPDPLANAYQYGDAYSYSLPILANYYNLQYGGGTGPGNPFYVQSTAGQIKDLVVIGVAANGGPVTTNVSGMDNAYETPSGSATTFTMTSANDPGGYIAGNGKWDTSLSALMAQINPVGDFPVFFFNNNEKDKKGDLATDPSQELKIWGQISLTGTGKTTLYFDLSNNITNANPVGGGIPGPISNVAAYVSPGPGDTSGGFVTSGGGVCVDKTTGNVDNACGPNTKTINHNLGDNQAAYAAIFPELNAILAMPNFDGYTDLHAEIRMTDLDSGGEQMFIDGGEFGTQPPPVPEPSTMMLLGMGMLGLAVYGKRRLNGK